MSSEVLRLHYEGWFNWEIAENQGMTVNQVEAILRIAEPLAAPLPPPQSTPAQRRPPPPAQAVDETSWASSPTIQLKIIESRRQATLAGPIIDGELVDDDSPFSPFSDVGRFLLAGMPEPTRPDVLQREDGNHLLYSGKVNSLFGDPECGKTFIGCAAVAEVLRAGGTAAFIDLDHNGVAEVIARLLLLGAPGTALTERFLHAEPEDRDQLQLVVDVLARVKPTVVVADSVGEMLPMLNLGQGDPNEIYRRAHRRVLTRLANEGSTVIAIDHLGKNDEARKMGQTGAHAKVAALNGANLRVTMHEAFVPGRGGSASLIVEKDRSGGLRAVCPPGKKPPAGRFVLETAADGTSRWFITTPRVDEFHAGSVAPDADVAELDGLLPPPRSQRDVQERLGWGGTRAMNALRMWRELRVRDE